MTERDLPEGVIDATPAGGWQSGDSADALTQERNAASVGSPELTESGLPENEPSGTADAAPSGAHADRLPEQDAVTPDDEDPDLRRDADIDDEGER